MNRFRSNRRRDGYVSLLAISFAFGLAALATATTVSLRAYLNASAARERLIVDRISLESAVARQAGWVARGARHAIVPHAAEPLGINGRAVAVDISLPEDKFDLAMDDPDELARALERYRLPASVAEGSEAKGLAARADAARLSAVQEDCLRTRFTLGRWPEQKIVQRAYDGEAPGERIAVAGDQIDIRAALLDPKGDTRLLWARVRLAGDETAGWLLHDYRRMQIGQANTAC